MTIEKSYEITYIDGSGKEVRAWLAPDVDPDAFNPISRERVIVLKADEGKVLFRGEDEIGDSTFIGDESEASEYREEEKNDDDQVAPEPETENEI